MTVRSGGYVTSCVRIVLGRTIAAALMDTSWSRVISVKPMFQVQRHDNGPLYDTDLLLWAAWSLKRLRKAVLYLPGLIKPCPFMCVACKTRVACKTCAVYPHLGDFAVTAVTFWSGSDVCFSQRDYHSSFSPMEVMWWWLTYMDALSEPWCRPRAEVMLSEWPSTGWATWSSGVIQIPKRSVCFTLWWHMLYLFHLYHIAFCFYSYDCQDKVWVYLI